jgi:hypothetical protein
MDYFEQFIKSNKIFKQGDFNIESPKNAKRFE